MEDFATSMLDVLVSCLRPWKNYVKHWCLPCDFLRLPGSCIRIIVHSIFVPIEIECFMIDSHPLQSVPEAGY